MKFSRAGRQAAAVAALLISFGATKPPAHSEDGDGVSYRNVGKTSHLDAAVGPRMFH